MSDNNYSLTQISDYAASKASKMGGYVMIGVAGYNLVLDVFQKNADFGMLINSFFVLGGVALASGLENKVMKRDKIAKEITMRTGY